MKLKILSLILASISFYEIQKAIQGARKIVDLATNCTNVCQQDGLFENRDDRTSYYECADGKSYFRRCPMADDRLSYRLFNGKECVEDEPKTDETENQLGFICPESTGVYSNPQNRHSFYECDKSEPKLKLCPRETRTHLHGAKRKHRRRMIWDGHQCVQVHRSSDSRSARQTKGLKEHKFSCPSAQGRFPHPKDERHYFVCENNVGYLKVCPIDTVFSGGDGGQCLHPSVDVMVNEAPQADSVQASQTSGEQDNKSCPPASVYDSSTGKCRRDEFPNQIAAVPEITVNTLDKSCPDGSEYDSSIGQCRREVLLDPIKRSFATSYTCPKDYTYDTALARCVRVTLVDPIARPAVVERQVSTKCPPGFTYDIARGGCYQITYLQPLNRMPETTECGQGKTYNAVHGRCIDGDIGGGRSRRNGRVEIEDSENGAVIVDTWNEAQYRWDRNHNGDKILTDINGWVDNIVHNRYERNRQS